MKFNRKLRFDDKISRTYACVQIPTSILDEWLEIEATHVEFRYNEADKTVIMHPL